MIGSNGTWAWAGHGTCQDKLAGTSMTLFMEQPAPLHIDLNRIITFIMDTRRGNHHRSPYFLSLVVLVIELASLRARKRRPLEALDKQDRRTPTNGARTLCRIRISDRFRYGIQLGGLV